MTAEIVIMNKQGVAIAADSAVTFVGEGDRKIFQSANKIFTLSKYHPIGIMIYGSANFMRLPWEVIVKTYRKKLGTKCFDRFSEYCEDFIAYLNGNAELFPEEEQGHFFSMNVFACYMHLKGEIRKETEKVIQKEGKIAGKKVGAIIKGVVESNSAKWEKAKVLPCFNNSDIRRLLVKYKDVFSDARKEILEKLPLSARLERMVARWAANLYCKLPLSDRMDFVSGVVFSGYGDKEIFPSVKMFVMHGVANNKLRFKEMRSQSISFDMGSSVHAFAQSEMVQTFMNGIDPEFYALVESYMHGLLVQYPDLILKNLPTIRSKSKESIRKQVLDACQKKHEEIRRMMRDFQAKKFSDPVISVVNMLPRDELAAMAESLVNLTSFKRKVSMEAETVGGPIDVAVISKGDGFVWIKRKHYFNRDLNPQFFANYFRRDGHDEESQG